MKKTLALLLALLAGGILIGAKSAPLWRGLQDRAGDELGITSAGEIVTVGRPHEEVHKGRSYELVASSTLATSGELELGFTTPASPDFVHVVVEVAVGGATTFSIEEGVGALSGGAAATPRNRNRNVLDASSVSDVRSGDLTYTAGTTIRSRTIGTKKDSASSGAFDREWVLKASTRYVFKAVSGENGNGVAILLNWYEDTYNGS